MEARVRVRYERISPMKVQWVIEHIKYKPVTEAFSILEQGNTKAARLLFKALKSAVANATTNHGMAVDNLYISYVVANPGPIIKRFSSRAKGRADEIRKETTLIDMRVSDEPKKAKYQKPTPQSKKLASAKKNKVAKLKAGAK